MPTLASRSAPPPVFILRGHDSPVTDVKYSADGTLLYSASKSGELKGWRTDTMRQCFSVENLHNRTVMKGACGGISSLCPLDNSQLLTYGRDGIINKWDIGQGSPVTTTSYPGLSRGFCGISVLKSANGECIAAVDDSEDHILILNSNLEVIHSISRNKSAGMPMALKIFGTNEYPQSPLVACLSEDGSLSIWNTASQLLLCSKLHTGGNAGTCFDLSSQDSTLGVSGSSGDNLTLFSINFQLGKIVKTAPLPIGSGVSKVAVRKDGKLFVAACWDHRVRVFALSGKPLALLRFHEENVSCLDFNPTIQNTFASGSADKRIAIWSIF
ncbi:F-box only protein 42 [Pelomyxa schiedti]|nr:F-box only protein 42 [Pelomyxa schiedti]